MEDGDDGEGEDGVMAGIGGEEFGAPGDEDDGVVGEGGDGGDEEEHGVSERLQRPRADGEGVHAAAAIHPCCGGGGGRSPEPDC